MGLFSASASDTFDLHVLPGPAPPHPTSSSHRGPILAPRPLTSKWASLDLPCGSWLAVHIGVGPKWPSHSPPSSRSPSLSSSVSILFDQNHASGHESPIVIISLYLFSSTLDEARFPRRDVGDTGEISEGWLRPSNHKPKTTYKSSRGPRVLGQVRGL